MHRLRSLPLFLCVLLLAACAGGQTSADVPSDDQPDGPTIEEKQQPDEGEEAPAEARVIQISARAGEFDPAEITIGKDERVILRLNGAEGTHGFSVPELGINLAVGAGQQVTVELPTDKEGEFDIVCTASCGEEPVVRGKIRVES